jgi:hypothetical protein
MKRSSKVLLLVAGGLLAICVAIPRKEPEPPIPYDELMVRIGRADAVPQAPAPVPAPVRVNAPVARPAPRPAPPQPEVPSNACMRAVPMIRSACPKLADLKLDARCNLARESQTSLDIKKLGPGVLVNIGAPGPEWYFTMSGNLVAINGLASGPCPGLPDYHEALKGGSR